ncbi:MAG: DUF2961 domain-containing protein [Spirochaetaceae bacterium]|nr:DUF2961 domain-containing protein [Spirochaetaceae bacterium]
MTRDVLGLHPDPARIDTRHEIRTISFENPTGERGGAARSHGGRKGAPNRMMLPGERIVLADVAGPGRVRHLWMTWPPMPPTAMRGLWMEVFYGDARAPSISVPCLDFFGLPLGRPVVYASALTAAQEGRGFNSWIPMPFADRLRIELVNDTGRRFWFYYQIAYTLGPEDAETGFLHVRFARENPTTLKHDFTIVDGLRGPGRFLGCNVGIRVLPQEGFSWYGEGEVKMYLDGDDEHPTWCGTGLEDYVGTAWGMGQHATTYQGAPLIAQAPEAGMPEFVSFYRWHLPDPIVFRESLRVTLQQIGAVAVARGQEAIRAEMEAAGRAAGGGFMSLAADGPLDSFGLCERQDDVCATAFVYCRDVQPVPRLDPPAALADLARREWEAASPFEAALELLGDLA